MLAKIMIQKIVEFMIKKVNENNGTLSIDSKTCNEWLTVNQPLYKVNVMVNGMIIPSAEIHLVKKQ